MKINLKQYPISLPCQNKTIWLSLSNRATELPYQHQTIVLPCQNKIVKLFCQPTVVNITTGISAEYSYITTYRMIGEMDEFDLSSFDDMALGEVDYITKIEEVV